jgi:hypothetical protein
MGSISFPAYRGNQAAGPNPDVPYHPGVPAHRETTPVFTDDSGRRARALQWAARGLCGVFVVLAGAVGLSLVTHVALPGLGGLLPPQAQPRHQADGGPRAAGTSAADPSDAVDPSAAPQTKPEASATSSAGATRAAGPTPRQGATGSVTSVSVRAGQPTRSAAPAATSPAAAPTTPAATTPAATRTPNPRSTLKGANGHASKTPNPRKPTSSPEPRAAGGRPTASATPSG